MAFGSVMAAYPTMYSWTSSATMAAMASGVGWTV
jgi:hypothetical protein